MDYSLIPHQVWLKLQEWYKGGPEIVRKIISDGFIRSEKVVEVYPLILTLLDERDKSQRRIVISGNILLAGPPWTQQAQHGLSAARSFASSKQNGRCKCEDCYLE